MQTGEMGLVENQTMHVMDCAYAKLNFNQTNQVTIYSLFHVPESKSILNNAFTEQVI